MKSVRNFWLTLRNSRMLRDISLMAAVSIFTYILSVRFDIFEHFSAWVASQNDYELDELIIVSMVLALMLLVFSVYRWQDIRTVNKKLRDISYCDELTGLANRRAFFTFAEQRLQVAKLLNKPFAVMFLDLDRFKMVNDTYGHKVGDLLLQLVGKRLLSCMREEDILARLGGDEFVILLSDTDQSGAEEKAVQIRELFKAPFIVYRHTIDIMASIGISIYPEHAKTVDQILQYADTAMYHAKEDQALDYIVYKNNMANTSTLNKIMEHELKQAIAQKEFQLHYQPQIDLQSRQIIGTEALLRWQHPQRGMLAPMEFIPLAEKTGLIIELGEWILEQACQQNKSWQQAGFPPITVAVNVSAKQLQKQGFTETVARILRKTGLDAAYLVLEITESIAVNQSVRVIETLEQINGLGVHIHIDDFGNGYSSLNYLKDFPIECIKIDRSFINNIAISPKDDIIVSAIIAMAHSLELSVTAEGVEDEPQLCFLGSRNCDTVQGFLIGKPMPVKEFEKRCLNR